MIKNKRFIFKLVLISLIFNFSVPLFSEENNSSQEEKNEIPQALQDIRRFEIITIGSLPFVMLDANLVYSGVKYFQNDMSKQYFPSLSPNLSKEEQTGVLLSSVGISLGIGITDLIVNLVTRNKKQKRNIPEEQPINIIPIEENPNAIKLPSLEEINGKKEQEIIQIEEDTN